MSVVRFVMNVEPEPLNAAVASLPRGRYVVGVSGGADSVALLHLLHHERPDCVLHVAHLDHQTRGEASAGDAAFVGDLAARWDLECTIATREQVEIRLAGKVLPNNPSARYRAIRHALFRQIIIEHRLDAVLLAHHADDQAETVFQRLMRGSSVPHLVGMGEETRLSRFLIRRPLLGVRRKMLRGYLVSAGQDWREDASNASDAYLRNRIRRGLAEDEELVDALLKLHEGCSALRDWIRRASPHLEERFTAESLARTPEHFACESARRWLVERGVPAGELAPGVVSRLLAMCQDAAGASRQMFPGGITLRRRGGWISAERASTGNGTE